jgi:hypothetical protein
VIVHGYRGNALLDLGFGAGRRRELNPSLIDVSANAYGFTGPWHDRRGFDSLVQMSCGIADRGREAKGASAPFPLPAQALDHATGYLLAAATCRGIVRALQGGGASEFHLSLARTAKLLTDMGDRGDPTAPGIATGEVDRWLETTSTAFGVVRRVRCPGGIDGIEPRWTIPAGPTGVDPPVWS